MAEIKQFEAVNELLNQSEAQQFQEQISRKLYSRELFSKKRTTLRKVNSFDKNNSLLESTTHSLFKKNSPFLSQPPSPRLPKEGNMLFIRNFNQEIDEKPLFRKQSPIFENSKGKCLILQRILSKKQRQKPNPEKQENLPESKIKSPIGHKMNEHNRKYYHLPQCLKISHEELSGSRIRYLKQYRKI